MIRLLLVDDHGLFRAGMRMLLDQQVDMQCLGECASGEEALRQVRNLKPDVVLCDLHLPGISGLEVTERLRKLVDGPKVIVVSMQEQGPLPRRALAAGANGYVSKAEMGEELLRAIRDVARGKRYLGAGLARALALESLEGQAASPFDLLSPREHEVAILLAHGLSPTEIARRLALSPKTVSTHKARLLAKLGLNDVVALARLASQYGLLDPTTALTPLPEAASAAVPAKAPAAAPRLPRRRRG